MEYNMSQSQIKSLAIEIASKHRIHLTRSDKYNNLSDMLQGKVRREAYKHLLNVDII
jgi:hypothetical protein